MTNKKLIDAINIIEESTETKLTREQKMAIGYAIQNAVSQALRLHSMYINEYRQDVEKLYYNN